MHEGLPEGLSPADNETGWREALARLAALVEIAGRRGALTRCEVAGAAAAVTRASDALDPASVFRDRRSDGP